MLVRVGAAGREPEPAALPEVFRILANCGALETLELVSAEGALSDEQRFGTSDCGRAGG